MTVIIKELVVKTGVVERKVMQPNINESRLRNEIMNDCLKVLKRRTKKVNER